MRRPSIALRAVAMAVLFAACAASAVFAGGAIGYAPLMMLVVAVAACAAYVAAAARSISLSVDAPVCECLRGETVELGFGVQNESALPFVKADVLVAVEGPYRCADASQAHTCLLSGRGGEPIRLRSVFEHVGRYRVGVPAVRVYDPAGLFWRTVSVDGFVDVAVLARTSDLNEMVIDPQALVESQHMMVPVANDGMDYAGVRAYVPGDPIKSIHWKLSARKGDHLTRLYETFANPGVSVFVSFSSSEYSDDELARANDLVAEVTFSLVAIARSGGFEVEVIFPDEHGEPMRLLPGDFDDPAAALFAMPKLAVNASACERFADLVERQASNPQRQSTFALVSASPDAALMRAALGVRAGGRTPLVFACVPSLEDYQVEKDRVRNLAVLDEGNVYYRRFSAVAQVEGA